MTAHSELRLLPWSGPDGKPCYLSTDNASSHLSRLADTAETAQLDLGQELLEHAWEVIADEESAPAELRLLARDLTEALGDTLRVAVSRGHRLRAPDSAAHGEEDAAPDLPAAAFS
ncbi:hypothetical protein EAO71_00605 [Streptomyces sp. ms191]|uniref:hypothetical protein n=1 Tax=Streptomyces sp. ms191 TaxID=1827978 RepID=UPI0011CE1973|nr:hypothetical protein [Streptomyces sp. ms191]TXS34565.1 hypothetical protein EAO71_00605 [Streptomyces sp. ms191]